jgi:hypothetical protein
MMTARVGSGLGLDSFRVLETNCSINGWSVEGGEMADGSRLGA